MTWKTINKDKLENEIDQRSAVLKALRRGRDKVPIAEGVDYNRVLAEHNALVAVLNSLQWPPSPSSPEGGLSLLYLPPRAPRHQAPRTVRTAPDRRHERVAQYGPPGDCASCRSLNPVFLAAGCRKPSSDHDRCERTTFMVHTVPLIERKRQLQPPTPATGRRIVMPA